MKCGCDVIEFACAGDSAGHIVLDDLEFVSVAGWKVKV